MNKKELIKLLDKYEIEYEITDNTKEVEEGLRLFDEALEKIGITISKGTRVDTITTENDLEVPKYTTEWASSPDIISRQGVIKAICQECVHGGYDECSVDCVVAEILRKLSPVEDAISRADTLKALCAECDLNCLDGTDKEAYCTEYAVIKSMPPVEPKLVSSDTISKEALIQSFLADCECKDRSEAKAVTCSLDTMLELIDDAPLVEPPKRVVAQIKVDTDELIERIKEEYEIKEKPVCEDAISRADTIKAMCSECKVFLGDGMNCADCTEVAIVRGMPPVEPERPKGEWIPNTNGDKCKYICSECLGGSTFTWDFCPNCGADMKGEQALAYADQDTLMSAT